MIVNRTYDNNQAGLTETQDDFGFWTKSGIGLGVASVKCSDTTAPPNALSTPRATGRVGRESSLAPYTDWRLQTSDLPLSRYLSWQHLCFAGGWRTEESGFSGHKSRVRPTC